MQTNKRKASSESLSCLRHYSYPGRTATVYLHFFRTLQAEGYNLVGKNRAIIINAMKYNFPLEPIPASFGLDVRELI